jgi:hypothetical protein
MKNFFWGVVAFFLFAFCACKPDKRGTGLYIYNPVSDSEHPNDTPFTVTSFLELRPDGAYTSDFGRFDYGSWNLKDTRLYLTNQHKKTYVYTVLTLDTVELELKLDSGRPGHFLVHTMASGQPEKDPFSLINNQWRIPPGHTESDAEIRQRLFNHCHFWETFFRWVDDKNEAVIDVSLFPTPLKVYGNGFGLRRYTDLSPEWKSCFFDTLDCHRADTLIKHTFRRNSIKWPDTDDDFKKLISGFQQLQTFLK